MEAPISDLGGGQVLLRTLWLSLDPYMRARMDEGRTYEPGLRLGDPMPGGLVSEVVESRHPDFAPGDIVQHHGGWQDHTVSGGADLRKLDPDLAPVTTSLGVLGMPGLTAYVGLTNIGQPLAGETLVVGAASGAVGSAVGQIAKLRGCRVVGIAGGERKCRYVLDELGFDAVVDHRDTAFPERLAQACPQSIDIYWENIGGEVLKAVLPLLNDFARVPVCGIVSELSAVAPPPNPDRLVAVILVKRLLFKGFIVTDHWAEQFDDFLRDMSAWLREGRIVYREDITDGLERAPERLIAMLRGENFGKTLIRVFGP